MAKPTLVVVTDDPGTLTAATQALERRFGADYQVVAADAPAAALTALGQAGEQVALLLAGQWLEGMTGIEFLCRAHELRPAAKRVLLIPFGDVAAGVAGLQAMALGQLDHWLNTPWGAPELQLYPEVSELLGQWARATARAGSRSEWVRVVGPRWSARSHELRDLLGRNNIPHGFYDAREEEGGGCWPRPVWRRPTSRWYCCPTGGCWSTRPPSGWPRRWGRRPGQAPAATTSPWSVPGRRAWPRPPTPPPKGSAPYCWSARRSAARPAPPP